jgi:hypothetical protein
LPSLKKMKILKTILNYLIAVVTAFLLASVAGTQVIVSELQGFGLAVPVSDRLAATLHDIAGLAPTLTILIAVAFLIAFVIAALGSRYVGGRRTYWYLAAGFTSPPAALMLLKFLMGATLFAAARTPAGMLLFALCGMTGGWLFARLTQTRTKE